ncbi:ATP-binding cassette domain-containing protein [Azospirillum brasilense]|uniref:ABC transporter ATP-binding protein n=1 Tax=Azospirillum brasilense TaxID=192 RepID=UPI00190BC26C|nr:ABC transporter ATP-binding protein [Azospirillum brasilense]MBK3732558.1 ATP-binding cassette domain-containing protein [Azospirillum brasilense]
MTLLHIRNLNLSADSGKPILRDVSLTLEKGQILALIGASGSGKTTLALTALGHMRPGVRHVSGQVLFQGQDLLRMSQSALARLRGRKLAYIAQSAAVSFNPRIRLDRQVTESSRIHHTMSPDAAHARAREVYRTLDLPTGEAFYNRFPHEVSGGQLQRFMIAMGLHEMPEILVCDEPTSALDATTQVEVLKALDTGIRASGTAAILVGHDIAQVVQIATHILVMRNGEVVERGTVEQILYHPEHPYTRQLLEMHRGFDAESGTTADTVATTGATAVSPPDRADRPPLLEVRDLAVYYGTGGFAVKALSGASLTLNGGEMMAVVGESGSGKSTMARAIAGLVQPSLGDVLVNGRLMERDVLKRPLPVRRAVQITFQSADTSLNRHHTVGRILGQVLTFFGERSKERRAERIRELLEQVHLPADYVDRKPSQMSGGEKQRVNLARSLAARPDVLICDEITSALDNIVAASVLDLINELKRELNIGILFISHDLSAVAAMSDKIMVLRNGEVVEQGPTAQVLGAPRHPYTRLLRSSVAAMRLGWLEEASALHRSLRDELGA